MPPTTRRTAMIGSIISFLCGEIGGGLLRIDGKRRERIGDGRGASARPSKAAASGRMRAGYSASTGSGAGGSAGGVSATAGTGGV